MKHAADLAPRATTVRELMLVTFVVLVFVPCLLSQDLPGSKDEVARFVRLKAKTIALENVRVIDGTGACCTSTCPISRAFACGIRRP